MTIETTFFTFKFSNTFEELEKMLDSPEKDAFHKTVGLTPLYRGNSLIHQKKLLFFIKLKKLLLSMFFQILKPLRI